MSYVEKPGDVMNIAEGLCANIFKKCLKKNLKTPFKIMKYDDAMSIYIYGFTNQIHAMI